MTYVITQRPDELRFYTGRGWSTERPDAKEYANKSAAKIAMRKADRTYNNMTGATVEDDEELAKQ